MFQYKLNNVKFLKCKFTRVVKCFNNYKFYFIQIIDLFYSVNYVSQMINNINLKYRLK